MYFSLWALLHDSNVIIFRNLLLTDRVNIMNVKVTLKNPDFYKFVILIEIE